MESVVMHGVKKLKEELTPWQIEKKIEKQLEDILKGQDWPCELPPLRRVAS